MSKKYKIIELEEMVGKTLEEVKTYLEKKYPNQLAKEEDIEAFKAENPDLPDEWIWFYFFGSTFRRQTRSAVSVVSKRFVFGQWLTQTFPTTRIAENV